MVTHHGCCCRCGWHCLLLLRVLPMDRKGKMVVSPLSVFSSSTPTWTAFFFPWEASFFSSSFLLLFSSYSLLILFFSSYLLRCCLVSGFLETDLLDRNRCLLYTVFIRGSSVSHPGLICVSSGVFWGSSGVFRGSSGVFRGSSGVFRGRP